MMTNDKLAELQQQGRDYIAAAKAIADEFGPNPADWPDPARERYDDNVDKAGKKLAEIQTAKADLNVMAKAREIGEAIGFTGLEGSSSSDAASSTKGRRLTFTGMAHALAGQIRPTG